MGLQRGADSSPKYIMEPNRQPHFPPRLAALEPSA